MQETQIVQKRRRKQVPTRTTFDAYEMDNKGSDKQVISKIALLRIVKGTRPYLTDILSSSKYILITNVFRRTNE